jgi:hypothetical protein
MGAAELTRGGEAKVGLGIGGLFFLFMNILAVSFFIVAFVAMIVFIVRNEKRPASSLVVFYL